MPELGRAVQPSKSTVGQHRVLTVKHNGAKAVVEAQGESAIGDKGPLDVLQKLIIGAILQKVINRANLLASGQNGWLPTSLLANSLWSESGSLRTNLQELCC